MRRLEDKISRIEDTFAVKGKHFFIFDLPTAIWLPNATFF